MRFPTLSQIVDVTFVNWILSRNFESPDALKTELRWNSRIQENHPPNQQGVAEMHPHYGDQAMAMKAGCAGFLFAMLALLRLSTNEISTHNNPDPHHKMQLHEDLAQLGDCPM
jgi:hypothetical protein